MGSKNQNISNIREIVSTNLISIIIIFNVVAHSHIIYTSCMIRKSGTCKLLMKAYDKVVVPNVRYANYAAKFLTSDLYTCSCKSDTNYVYRL